MTEKIGLIAIFDTSQFNKGLADYLGGVDKATGATEKAEGQGFSFARALEVGVGVALEKVAELAIKAAGALLQIGTDSVNLASEFQVSMVTLQTAASSSGLSLDELSKLTLQVGADSNVLGASATGAADAMINLYRAGLQDNAVFGDMQGYLAGTAELGGVLKASFDLAAASELDVAQASELGIVALSVFGSALEDDAAKGEFAAAALDNLVKTANASNASVSDLSEALKYAGPDAANFGMSVEDTNLALALLSDSGVKGSMAGTTLSSVMRDLTKGTDASTAALEAMGVSIYDTEGATRPLIDIIGDMEIALDGKTQAEKDAYLQDIFTSQGMRGINVLLKEGTTGWNEMGDAIDGATGLQAQAEAQSKTYAAQMEALDGQVETLKIQFGTALLPALTSFIETIIPIIEQYGPALNTVMMDVGNVVARVATAFQAFVSGDIDTAISALGGIIAQVFGGEAKDAFIDFANWLQVNLPIAIEFAKNAFNEGVQFIGMVISVFISFLDSIKPSLDLLYQNVVTVWEALKVNAQMIWQGIQFIIDGALKIILGFVGMFINTITGNWSGALENLQMLAEGAWVLITGIIQTALATILTLAGTNLTQLVTTIAQLWVIVKTYTQTAWDAIKTAISNAWTAITAAVGTALNEVKTAFVAAWEALRESADRLSNSILTTIKNILSPSNLMSIGSDIINGLISGISAAAGGLTAAISSAIDGAIAAAKAKLGIQSPSKVFAEIGVNTMLGMAQGVNSSAGIPQSAVQSAVGGLMSSPITTNNVDNSRNVNLQINNNGVTGNRTYFDVVAGLQAVGI